MNFHPGFTNLTEYRLNANVSITDDDGDGSGTPLGGDPILDEFQISEEELEVRSLEVLWLRLRNRIRTRIFIIFQKFLILIPIPIPAKIDFLIVLESIPKSDIYDSDSDSSKKRNHNTSSYDSEPRGKRQTNSEIQGW